jgi:hypothetical protein
MTTRLRALFSLNLALTLLVLARFLLSSVRGLFLPLIAASRLLLSRFRHKNVGFPPIKQPLALEAEALASGCLKKMGKKKEIQKISYLYERFSEYDLGLAGETDTIGPITVLVNFFRARRYARQMPGVCSAESITQILSGRHHKNPKHPARLRCPPVCARQHG